MMLAERPGRAVSSFHGTLRLPVPLDVRLDVGGPEEQAPADPNASDLATLAEPKQRRARNAAELCAGCLL